MSGLSDEAGAGAGLAMAVKQVGSPSAIEIQRLEEYVNSTLYQGNHQTEADSYSRPPIIRCAYHYCIGRTFQRPELRARQACYRCSA